MSAPAQMQRQVPASREGVSQLIAAVEQFTAAVGLSAKTRAELLIIMDELSSNSLKYGSPGQPEPGSGHQLGLRIRLDNCTLLVEYSDDGLAFNPLKVEAQGLDLEAQERAVGGLGIHLVRSLTDTQSYRHEQGSNIISLSLKIK